MSFRRTSKGSLYLKAIESPRNPLSDAGIFPFGNDPGNHHISRGSEFPLDRPPISIGTASEPGLRGYDRKRKTNRFRKGTQFVDAMPNVQANRRAAPTLAKQKSRTGPSG